MSVISDVGTQVQEGLKSGLESNFSGLGLRTAGLGLGLAGLDYITGSHHSKPNTLATKISQIKWK